MLTSIFLSQVLIVLPEAFSLAVGLSEYPLREQ